MVCMDGFILTHAVERVDLPDAGAGRRLPAAVRAAPGARPRRAGDDRRDGRARGVHRGQVPHARQADAGARRDPADRRASSSAAFGRDSGGLVRGYRDRGRRDGRRRARLGARHDRGRRRRAARARRAASARVGDQVRSARTRSRRCARRSAHAAARRRAREGVRRRRRRHRRPERPARAVRASPSQVLRRRSPGSAAGRSPSASLHALLDDALAGPARAGSDLPRPRRRARRARARARAATAARARTPRTCCATSASSPEGRSDGPTSRSSSTRSAAFAVGNRLLDARASARCRPTHGRSNALTSGHRACQGCGEALGARYVLDAAMRATDGQLIAANATGCLEVFSTPYPETLVAAAVDPLAVRQRAGGRHRRRRRAEGQGPRPTCAWSARAATAAPSTSASAACRGCSSATTTCSTSATTTRAT